MMLENGKGGSNDDTLMHFEIPYDWKGTLRGLFWIFIFTLFFWSFLAYLAVITAGMNYICLISGYVIMVAIYLLIRYVSVKYDKIKAKREIIVYPEKFVYKQGDYTFEVPYLKTIRLDVEFNDKQIHLLGYYGKKINGFEMWEWRAPSSTIIKDVGYKKFVEEKAIPFAKLLIKRIKEVNPNLEVIWKDTRKKYR